MRAAVALGVQLAFRSGRVARLRSALVAGAALVGTTVMLAVTALARAGQATASVAGADMTWLTVAVVTGIGLPVLVLAATVGRLSAELRDRRLANLRLMGLSAWKARTIAITETAVAAGAGTLTGLAAFWAVRPLLTHVPLWGTTYPLSWIRPTAIGLVTVVAGVPLAVAAVSSLPQRLDLRSALARARRNDARRPALWRLVPLAIGLAWCWYFSSSSPTDRSPTWITVNLLGSVIALGLGTVLVLPVVVRLTGDLVLLMGRSTASTIAARRIQAQPAGVTRVIGGLLIGLFLVTGAHCVVVAFESTPQYQYADRNVNVEQRTTVTVEQDAVSEATRELEGLDGVRGIIVSHYLAADEGCESNGLCEQAVVASCADLASLAPDLSTCPDAPLWLGGPSVYGPDFEMPDEIRWTTLGGHEQIVLPAPDGSISDQETLNALEPLTNGSVLIPADLPGMASLNFEQADLVVRADPGRDLIDRIVDSGLGDNGVSGFGTEDYDYVRTLRALVWTVAAVILALGLLSFAIAALDRALARRREIVALQLVGVPRRVLRQVQWIEAGAPVIIGALLAIALGTAAGATYLALASETLGVPWGAVGLLALVAAAGAVVVTALTVLASSPPLRADLIRGE